MAHRARIIYWNGRSRKMTCVGDVLDIYGGDIRVSFRPGGGTAKINCTSLDSLTWVDDDEETHIPNPVIPPKLPPTNQPKENQDG